MNRITKNIYIYFAIFFCIIAIGTLSSEYFVNSFKTTIYNF